MKKEAEEHAEEDKKAKENIDTLNSAESYIFSIKKSMNELGEKLTDDLKEPLNKAIEELEESVKKGEVEEVKELKTNLENVWTPIAESLYKAKTAESGTTEGTNMNGNPMEGIFTDNPFNNGFNNNSFKV